jgi:hypothetical protein
MSVVPLHCACFDDLRHAAWDAAIDTGRKFERKTTGE